MSPGAELLRRRRAPCPELEEQRAHPLLRVRARRRRASGLGRDRALEDAEEVDPARERVGDRLEDERGGRRRPRCRRDRAAPSPATARPRRSGRAARACRGSSSRRRSATGKTSPRVTAVLERVRDLVRVELLALEVALHQRLVGLDDLVEQLLAVLLRPASAIVVRDRRRARPPSRPRGSCTRTCGARRRSRSARARRRSGGGRRRSAARAAPGSAPSARKKSARSRSSMLTKSTRARPSSSARFQTRPVPTSTPMTPLSDDERALDDAQRAARLALEARVAGHVDQVDLPALPLGVRERERDRHPPLLLVVVPVRDRRARFDRAEPVRLAGLEEQRLDERGLARPTVADDGDVADLSRLESGHAGLPPRRVVCGSGS